MRHGRLEKPRLEKAVRDHRTRGRPLAVAGVDQMPPQTGEAEVGVVLEIEGDEVVFDRGHMDGGGGRNHGREEAMAVGPSRRPPTSAQRLDAGEVDFQLAVDGAAAGQFASLAEADEADRFGGGHLSLSSLDRRKTRLRQEATPGG